MKLLYLFNNFMGIYYKNPYCFESLRRLTETIKALNDEDSIP